MAGYTNVLRQPKRPHQRRHNARIWGPATTRIQRSFYKSVSGLINLGNLGCQSIAIDKLTIRSFLGGLQARRVSDPNMKGLDTNLKS